MTADTASLREKLASVNESALRARLTGNLVEAAQYQREVMAINRWIKAINEEGARA